MKPGLYSIKNPLPQTRKQTLAYALVNNKQKAGGSSNYLTDKNNFLSASNKNTNTPNYKLGSTSLGTSLGSSLGTSLGSSTNLGTINSKHINKLGAKPDSRLGAKVEHKVDSRLRTKVTKNPLLKDSYAILDLDHTLINTETTEKPDMVLEENCDFHFKLQGHHYYVFKRPGVDKFIDTLIKNFKGIAVWTAAMATYAKQIIKGLFGINKAPSLLLIWTRCQTQNDEDGLYKALIKLWKDPVYGNYMNPQNTVHIDNTESVMRYNSDQALLVPDFHYYTVQNGLKTFNTTDNYLIFLDDLIKELIRTKQDTLKNFIIKGNKLTQWYPKSHTL
ncbi:MAG: HAD family hydrolase [Candidatus Paceibacterota bacterium]